jgi:hypothetical protein
VDELFPGARSQGCFCGYMTRHAPVLPGSSTRGKDGCGARQRKVNSEKSTLQGPGFTRDKRGEGGLTG